MSQDTPKLSRASARNGQGSETPPIAAAQSALSEGLRTARRSAAAPLPIQRRQNPTRSRTPYKDYPGIPPSKTAGGLLVRSAGGALSGPAPYVYVFNRLKHFNMTLI